MTLLCQGLVKVEVEVELKVKVEDEVEDEVEVALLYFACIYLLQKDSCARLLYFTLQNVIGHSVVDWWWWCAGCGGLGFSDYSTTLVCLTFD